METAVTNRRYEVQSRVTDSRWVDWGVIDMKGAEPTGEVVASFPTLGQALTERDRLEEAWVHSYDPHDEIGGY